MAKIRPFAFGGCIAQAWSIAEVLRSYVEDVKPEAGGATSFGLIPSPAALVDNRLVLPRSGQAAIPGVVPEPGSVLNARSMKLRASSNNDLRRLAAHYLRSEDPGHTLQATGLVHELYLRINSLQDRIWKNRGHFMAVSAQMMRRILNDHARRRALARRDDGRSVPSPVAHAWPDVLDVDRALEKLNAVYPRHAHIVELRFFGGFEVPKIALALDLSVRTVERDWRSKCPSPQCSCDYKPGVKTRHGLPGSSRCEFRHP